MTTATIGGLYVYPVKSCGGLYAHAALLTPRGLHHDREWMVVDAGTDPARFLTQRTEAHRIQLPAQLVRLWACHVHGA